MIENIPKEIGMLKELNNIELGNNKIRDLPDELFTLNNLYSLTLTNNRLEYIPKKIKKLMNLSSLNLGCNKIKKIPKEVCEINNLTYLYLTKNLIDILPSEIMHLKKLRSLHLSQNSISSISKEIGILKNLRRLYLDENLINKIPQEIFNLNKLEELSLSRNQIKVIPKEINMMIKLKKIFINNNPIETIPIEIKSLKKLTDLYLSNTKIIKLPKEFSGLNNIVKLNEKFSNLNDIPDNINYTFDISLNSQHIKVFPTELFKYRNLIENIDLSDNSIKEIPKNINSFIKLKNLNLSYNLIDFIPKELCELNDLSSLELIYNQIKEVPIEIINLKNLIKLNLSHNQIKEIPHGIGNLKNLTKLYFRNNRIEEIPKSIGNLDKLVSLRLGFNSIEKVPDDISKLSNLKYLDLDCNKIKELPKGLCVLNNLETLTLKNILLTKFPIINNGFKNLKYIYLDENFLKEIPKDIINIKNLKELNLYGNNMIKPPFEVCSKGIESIRNYFKQIDEEGIDYLYEAKLILVGEPEAGKTSLAKKILDRNYKLNSYENSTRGIELNNWTFKLNNRIKFKVNIWDFGGQEIYHNTHQFFLTKRSLYILLADSRKEDTDFFHWLNTIDLLSENSTVLIVNNEKDNRRKEIPINRLKSEFMNIQDNIFRINLADNRGLDNLIEIIKFRISNLSHIGSPLPKSWIKVREYLENDKRNYINVSDFYNICEINGFKNKRDKIQLSEYLHDIGVILHFQRIPLLNRIVILKPEWGTRAVYKILDNNNIISNYGKFKYSDLNNIWLESCYEKMYDELLILMMEFRLCYKIPNTNNYLVPQLLKENQQIFNCNKSEKLIFYYEYDFMPKGIISRLIVGFHELIFKNKVWKSGVIVYKDDTYAKIIENYNKKQIKICIYGNRKKELHAIIRYEIEKIHKTYSKNLNYNINIPCICKKCINENSYYYTFKDLMRYITNNRKTIECRNSFENVEIKKLIDDNYFENHCEKELDSYVRNLNNPKLNINSDRDIYLYTNPRYELLNFDKNKGQINLSKDNSVINSNQNEIFFNIDMIKLWDELNILKIEFAIKDLYDEAKLIKQIIDFKDKNMLIELIRSNQGIIIKTVEKNSMPQIYDLINKIF